MFKQLELKDILAHVNIKGNVKNSIKYSFKRSQDTRDGFSDRVTLLPNIPPSQLNLLNNLKTVRGKTDHLG